MDPKDYIVVGFDGPICAGKTTLVRELSREIKAAMIEEYWEYSLKLGWSFPDSSTSRSVDSLRTAEKFFIYLEQERLRDFKNLRYKGNQIFLVDRTYLSCLAYDYAFERVTVKSSFFQEARKLWLEAPKIEADLVICMTVAQPILETRLVNRGNPVPPILMDKKFNLSFQEFFHICNNDAQKLIKLDASQSKRTVKKQALDIINTNFFIQQSEHDHSRP